MCLELLLYFGFVEFSVDIVLVHQANKIQTLQSVYANPAMGRSDKKTPEDTWTTNLGKMISCLKKITELQMKTPC